MEENSPPPIDEISPQDWETTTESVKRLVRKWLEQIAEIGQLMERIEQLERQYEEVKVENQLLKERVQQNSQNSSKPPSQDQGKGFKVKEKRQGKKKPGAQPGHEGHERPLYSVEQCQSVEDYYPSECIHCGEPLAGEDHEPYRIQNVEIPQVVPEVREHRFRALRCQQCGGYTRAWDEMMINSSGYGERVVAHVEVLSGQYRQSHRMVQELLDELFGIKISVGSIN
ncbi:hypothetical protein IFO70_39305 [Phormidium tenue FACHB-886]|nr:hypothetical protein [Phormidium tenue FACHB-886]